MADLDIGRKEEHTGPALFIGYRGYKLCSDRRRQAVEDKEDSQSLPTGQKGQTAKSASSLAVLTSVQIEIWPLGAR